ncbi:MAG: thioredoxin family protein [Anaeroplasma sp.]
MILEYNFQSSIDGYALLFFYASWSSNCNLHQDAIKRIASENKDLNIYKINTTKYPNLKQKYNVHKIPTFILLNDNRIVSRVDGYKDGYSLSKWVKNNRI